MIVYSQQSNMTHGFQESKVLCGQSDIQNYIKQQEEQQRI